MTRAIEEAWAALEETSVYHPPSRPPPANPYAETLRYLAPAVPVFFGERCCHPAHQPCPPTSQHAATEAYDALERTLDGHPSGVRAAPTRGAGPLQAPDARAAGGGSAMGVGGSVLGGEL